MTYVSYSSSIIREFVFWVDWYRDLTILATTRVLGGTMKDPILFSAFAHPTTRRQIVLGGAVALSSLTLPSLHSWAAVDDGISHSSESIHQEPVFQSNRKRVYEALTDAKQFDEIVRLSAAMRSGAIASKPAEISCEIGGRLTLFGGYIVGRQLDLVPGERIVQAWRAESWSPGEYSIVRFTLAEEGAATRIVFDHRAFPAGQSQHLAAGWKGNYWEPLEKYLAEK
jgi:activator of HSP90 ATPase